MKTTEAIAHYGTATKLARALCIEPQAVYQWGAEPPYARQCEIQVATQGALVAGVNPRGAGSARANPEEAA